LKEEASCDDKENSIDNSTKNRKRKHSSSNNLTAESSVMADCETASSRGEHESEDVNGNVEDVNGKSLGKDEPDDENSVADDNEMEPGEISFNPANALEMQVEQAAASAAALSEANALFNNAASMFQQPGMSMQTFQNAIAQFTANAIANNMDNETVMKNLAILQSALFTLQQQQFLQFQLIQHLQSQLVNKKNDGDMEKHNNNKAESDDEEQELKAKDDIDEEDGEMEEIDREHERQNQIHKRLMESKHFSKMQEALMKESELR
jgi:hypothetical protein